MSATRNRLGTAGWCGKPRVRLLLVLFLGTAYGWLSAVQNQNPYDARADMSRAWLWQPSPLWLPSYLLCKAPPNGFGIEHTRSGYLFRSDQMRQLYVGASTLLGAAAATGAYLSIWFWLAGRSRQATESSEAKHTLSS